MKKALIFLFILSVGSVLFAQQKFALVIGNARYTGISSLANPENDANDMEAALRALGFTVTKVLNGSRAQMETAMVNFKQRLNASANTYGFFFYAGHGIQSNGENYLIPVDADIPSENALRDRAVSLQWILAELNDARNELNIVVLDSCRDNPFSWSRSGTRGLTVVSRAPPGSIIFYATSDGRPAADGTGRNGLFTSNLLNSLRTPDLEITEVIRQTGAAVLQASGGAQIPATYNQFFGTAYLGSRPSPSPTPTPTPVPVPPSPSSVENNMVRINGGTFLMGSPSNERSGWDNKYEDEGPQHQVTISAFFMGRYEVTQREYQEVMGTNPSYFKGDNLPVENVSWYDAIEYCNRRSQIEGLTPAYTIDKTRIDPNNLNLIPYYGVYDNMKWIVTWNRNANGYRLPTEAEWEYACRAGTATAYNTGAGISDNTGWYSDSTTHPVGQKPPNAWGLYDMHGNVEEWCWDWYDENYYRNSPSTDPLGASSGNYRVQRGGSSMYAAHTLRSAWRGFDIPPRSVSLGGFRVARNAQ